MTSCLLLVGWATAMPVEHLLKMAKQGQHGFDTVAYTETYSPGTAQNWGGA